MTPLSRRASAAILALALSVLPFAAIAGPAIPLPWDVGTKLEYRSATVDEKFSKGVRRIRTTRADTTLEIIEATDAGFVQTWRDRNASITLAGDGPDLAAEERVAQAMLASFDDEVLEVVLDAQGLFTGVRNWQPLGAKMRTVLLPLLRAQVRATDKTGAVIADADLDAKLAPTLERMTTQAVLDVTLGKQASIYNLFTAPAIQPGKPVRYEDTLQSPVSDHRIPAIGTFEVTGVDEAADTMTIRWTQSIDPVKGADVAWQMVEALLGRKMPIDRAGLPTDLLLTDAAIITVQRSSGIPQLLVHERNLNIGGDTRKTTWTFAIKPESAGE